MNCIINIVDTSICNYDGKCQFCNKGGYGWCYGEKYGTDECPLKSKYIIVEYKDDKWEEDFFSDEGIKIE